MRALILFAAFVVACTPQASPCPEAPTHSVRAQIASGQCCLLSGANTIDAGITTQYGSVCYPGLNVPAAYVTNTFDGGADGGGEGCSLFGYQFIDPGSGQFINVTCLGTVITCPAGVE